MHRAVRPIGSFVVVLVAYWAYALVAVPLIEPPANPSHGTPISEAERLAAQGRIDAALAELQGLFPPGAWELGNPKILESDRLKLLMQDYRNLGNGRVEIRPCTIILTPERIDLDNPQPSRQAVILQAPEGALLEFDGPFDLRRMKIGRLVGGRLMGPITIRSQGKSPGIEDDLLITTRDVELTQQNVFTPHPVSFRYGPHYGSGAQMRIKLLSVDQTEGAQRPPSVEGIEFFELRRLDRLHLELGKLPLGLLAGPAPTAAGPDPPTALPPPAEPPPEPPIEITCQGPFRFDVAKSVATFEDRVDVLRIDPAGQSDQLNCQLLSVFFSDPSSPPLEVRDDAAGGPQQRPAKSLNLRPVRIEARGDPVVVVAPSQGAHARGQHLEYDLTTGRIAAKGPGWLRAQIDQRHPDQQFEARWNEQLQVRSGQENQAISLSGAAELDFPGIGRLDAGEIHFWFSQSAPQRPDERPALRPDRMLARNQVQITSPALSAAVEQLEVWFEPPETSDTQPPSGRRLGDQPADTPAFTALVSADRPPAHPDPLQPAPASAPARQHLEVSGRLLQAAMVLPDDGPAALSELIVHDGVRFVETQTEEPGQRPLMVWGDWLHVVDADKPHAAVTVTGRPAHFEGRGLALTGENINLNRGTNQLWIDAPGRMDLAIDRDLDGRPLDQPVALQVNWQHSMVFDGRTARFEESVTAATPHHHLQTETLEVQLQQPIDFSADKIQQEPKTQQLLCRGAVLMENLSFEEQVQTSQERMQVADLAVNLDSGALKADGPGWLTSVRLRSHDPLAARAGGPATAGQNAPQAPDAPPGSQAPPLSALHVRFQGSLSGNILPSRREMTFHDRVQTAYAPADSWEAVPSVDDPDSLGPNGMLMTCDRLTVDEMPTSGQLRPSIELLADGNTVVESSALTARAIRISYAEAKDLLILEGDARTDAQLFHQPRLGGPTEKHTARKIYYWPQTGRLRIEDARSLELDRLSSP